MPTMQLADGVPNGVVSDCALKEEVGWLLFLSNLTRSRDTSVAKYEADGSEEMEGNLRVLRPFRRLYRPLEYSSGPHRRFFQPDLP